MIDFFRFWYICLKAYTCTLVHRMNHNVCWNSGHHGYYTHHMKCLKHVLPAKLIRSNSILGYSSSGYNISVIFFTMCSKLNRLTFYNMKELNINFCGIYEKCKNKSPQQWELGPVPISKYTPYWKISRSKPRYLCLNMFDHSQIRQAFLPRRLSNLKLVGWYKLPLSWFRDFAISYDYNIQPT